MFHMLRKTLVDNTNAYLQLTLLVMMSIGAFWISLDLSQFAGSAEPIVPFLEFDQFSIGAACLFVIAIYSGYSALQTYDRIRTGC